MADYVCDHQKFMIKKKGIENMKNFGYLLYQ